MELCAITQFGHWLIGERATGQQWQELLAVLFQASQSSNASQREGAFRIFATTPGIIEKQHEDTVLAAFTKGFEDEDVSVRVTRPILTHLWLTDSIGTIGGNGGFRLILPIYH